MKRLAYPLLLALSIPAFAQTTTPPPAATVDIKFFADIAMKLEKAEEKARHDALDAANNYRQAAEMKVRQQLAVKPEYKAAQDELATAQRVQGEARTLKDAQLIVASTSRVSQATANLKDMEDAALATDMDVQAARSIIDKLQSSAPKPLPVTPETPIAGSPLPGGGTQTIMGNASASATAQSAGSKPTHRPTPTTIEIGQTRDELLAFLNANRGHYRVIAFNASRPAGWTGVEYIGNVQRNVNVRGSIQTNTQVNGGPTDSVNTNGTAATTANINEHGQVSSHRLGSKVEYATIATLGAHEVVVGYHRNALGGTSPDREVQEYQTGTVDVLLVDDVIAQVSANTNINAR